ncbi:MAG TPA: response regulator [Candidatus Saccharimonadales bacterium]|nr:response regulator [Candidatus Saccharimonadales bacterium]
MNPQTTICIVEDEIPIAIMYEYKLMHSGYSVQIAHDGLSGFELLKRCKPDLLLLDIRMPLMTGDEMLEKVRATDWGAAIRCIVLTNISKDEAPQKLRFLNVDRYIVKAHHTPSQVVSIVEEVLARRAQANNNS